MGPIPKRSFIVERLPLSVEDRIIHAASRLIRRLPPPVVRALVMLDLVLSIIPVWAWFAYRRWSGIALSPREWRRRYVQGCRFAVAQLRHHGEGTGAFQVDWRSPPIRHASARERPDAPSRGSCGTCTNCCTTRWLPPAERQTCPLLGADGCRIYGGLYWDYFNCGRYPFAPRDVLSYECPRFEGPAAAPTAVPMRVAALRIARALPLRPPAPRERTHRRGA